MTTLGTEHLLLKLLREERGVAVREMFPSVAEAMYFLYRIDGKNRR